MKQKDGTRQTRAKHISLAALPVRTCPADGFLSQPIQRLPKLSKRRLDIPIWSYFPPPRTSSPSQHPSRTIPPQSLNPKTLLSIGNFFFLPLLPTTTGLPTFPSNPSGPVLLLFPISGLIVPRSDAAGAPSLVCGLRPAASPCWLPGGGGHASGCARWKPCGVLRRCSRGLRGESKEPRMRSALAGVAGRPGVFSVATVFELARRRPMPNSPRFGLSLLPGRPLGRSAGWSGALPLNEPAARAAPCGLPFVRGAGAAAELTALVEGTGGLRRPASLSSPERSVESPSSSPGRRGMPRTGVRSVGRAGLLRSSSSESTKRERKRGAPSSESLESSKRLLKRELDLGGAGFGSSLSGLAKPEKLVRPCDGAVSAGRKVATAESKDARPGVCFCLPRKDGEGDKDLILNLRPFVLAGGDDGRKEGGAGPWEELLKLAFIVYLLPSACGGGIARTCGDIGRAAGAAGGWDELRMLRLMEYRPPSPTVVDVFCLLKLLSEASEPVRFRGGMTDGFG